ncbi:MULTISPECIES: hypothetical protein [unclassified Streptomyces]|uniref:hypothetical protein n=1 Tax=unclassified Streptomyces TaxID=2593676 RepID=UPI00099BCD05|nr:MULTISPECIES: hypothetical protein [unclassified Streptomyces]
MRRRGKEFDRGFGRLAVLGALLVVGGIVGLVHTGAATLTSMLLFGWTLLQGAFGLLLGLLALFDWPHSSWYVLGAFFSLALLFDGLGLIAIGVGGRRIVSMVTPPEPVSGPAPKPPRGSSAEPFPESSESVRNRSNN